MAKLQFRTDGGGLGPEAGGKFIVQQGGASPFIGDPDIITLGPICAVLEVPVGDGIVVHESFKRPLRPERIHLTMPLHVGLAGENEDLEWTAALLGEEPGGG